MNTLVSKTNRINRRMESSPIQRKLQKVSRDVDENTFNARLKTPKQRKVRRVRSSDNHSSRSASASSRRNNEWTKENHSAHVSPLQRKLMREDSNGKSGSGSGSSGGASGNGSSSARTTAQSVIDLLELLQNSPYAMMKSEVDAIKEQRKLPARSYSEELFTPSRRHKRTGARIPLRMMPKVKPASMGDLFNENGTRERKSGRKKSQSPKGLIRKGRKGDYRFMTDEFQSDSSPRSPRSRMNQGKHDRWNLDDCDKIPKPTFVADFDNQDQSKHMQEPTFIADFENQNEIKNIQDFIDIESSRPNTEKRTSNADESWDRGSMFQEAPSTLGDFHNSKSPRRHRPKDSPVRAEQRPIMRDKRPKGVVTHTSSNISDSTREEDDKARRRRTRCSAGGKVRNHRTQEEYTGFFLTSPTEDNLKHGYGITKFPDGRLFEGVYERGTMIEGKMTYPAAAGSTAPTYVGKFDEAGYRCGKGIYTTATTTFLGQFRRDQQHGSGILIYHDGSDGADTSQSRRFIGHWKDGLKHGHGREILANGTITQEGLWEAGRFVGAGTSHRRRA